MVLVWFVYGLAFFVLGLVILVYPKKDSRFDLARHVWMIGVFGIVHGLNEWFNMFLEIGGPLPLGPTDYGRVLTLSGSFFFLVQFGVAMLSRRAKRRQLVQTIPFLPAAVWLIVFFVSDPDSRLLMGDIWARYLLCAPGALLTAWALFSQMSDFKTLSRRPARRGLAVAAVTLLAYGILAGLFVKKAGFFPAAVFNYETFRQATGLPVQVFRAALAIVAAWSIIRVLDVFRLEAQDALRASELRCATIASAMPVFLFMTDRDMTVTFVQGKGLEALGLSAEQIRGRHIRDAFPGGQNLVEDCRRALSGQELSAAAVLAKTPFEIYYSTLKDRTGAITNVVGVALDISARIQTQTELDEYRRRLEKRAREAAVGMLSATVAKQLVEPLSVAQLMLERAAAPGSGVPDAIHGNIGKALSELLKARETLGRFMEMAQPGAVATEQPVGLYQIAKRTMSVFADSAQRRRLTIAIKDMDIVPLMGVSPREVEQVFYHLMQRAVDAADAETEQRLVISCVAGEGHIDLLFSDTCGKIQAQRAEADIGSVLDDLEAAGGQGLDLAVVKGIVAGRGGTITVDTGPGNTTTFRVRLPVTRTY